MTTTLEDDSIMLLVRTLQYTPWEAILEFLPRQTCDI